MSDDARAARRRAEVRAQGGMHGRVLASVVRVAREHRADVVLRVGGEDFDATSAMQLSRISGPENRGGSWRPLARMEVEVVARGPEADAAADAVADHLNEGLHDHHRSAVRDLRSTLEGLDAELGRIRGAGRVTRRDRERLRWWLDRLRHHDLPALKVCFRLGRVEPRHPETGAHHRPADSSRLPGAGRRST